MGNARRAVVVSVCWAWMGGAADARAQTDPTALIVRAYAEAGVDASWLPAVDALTRKIFGEAGMQLVWTRCDAISTNSRCHAAPEPNEFVVRFQARRIDAASHACGVSLRPSRATGHYITLFLDCIREGSDTFAVAEPIIAAYAIAHEIGHLLLPAADHAPSGIMRARPDRFDWERAKRGALGFRPAERQQMQEALRRRLASAM